MNYFTIGDQGILIIYEEFDYYIEIWGEVGIFWKAGEILGFGKQEDIEKQRMKAIKLIWRIGDKIGTNVKLQDEVDEVSKINNSVLS
jgi:hypothetical protein